MQRFFQDALLPTPAPVVLGRQLRPLGLGHVFVLATLHHPLLFGGPLAPPRVIEAVHVCSHAWPVPLVGLAADKSVRELTRAASRGMTARKWLAQVAAIQAYTEAAVATPEQWRKDNRQYEQRVPWPLRLAASLVMAGIATRADVWDMPLAEAVAWNLARRENEGDQSVLSDREIEAAS